MTKKALPLTHLGVTIGAFAGCIYHAKFDSLSGTCAITSKWVACCSISSKRWFY